MKIGVLALQGDFSEHIAALRKLSVDVFEVRLPSDLKNLDGLIIPGGESTVIGKLATEAGLIAPLQEFGKEHAIWGTCAGAIFLAKYSNEPQPLLSLMDLRIERNAFGRQINSFQEMIDISSMVDKSHVTVPFQAIFIRSPMIRVIEGDVKPLATLSNGTIIAAQQRKILVTTFHPELTDDLRFHQYFLTLVKLCTP